MGVEQEIEAIRFGIRTGRFSNEASVSQGIVLRLLHALGWPAYNTDAVWPEYSLSGRRVDFALCSPPSKPIAFIEVKQIGQSDGAERQLFEYAYHDGVPMAASGTSSFPASRGPTTSEGSTSSILLTGMSRNASSDWSGICCTRR
jgi:predicted type IV restriction endonuclease